LTPNKRTARKKTKLEKSTIRETCQLGGQKKTGRGKKLHMANGGHHQKKKTEKKKQKIPETEKEQRSKQ